MHYMSPLAGGGGMGHIVAAPTTSHTACSLIFRGHHHLSVPVLYKVNITGDISLRLVYG